MNSPVSAGGETEISMMAPAYKLSPRNSRRSWIHDLTPNHLLWSLEEIERNSIRYYIKEPLLGIDDLISLNGLGEALFEG